MVTLFENVAVRKEERQSSWDREDWGYGVTAKVSRLRVAMEGLGHTHGSGTVVVDDREVGLGWNLILLLFHSGAVAKSLNLSMPFCWSPWDSRPVSCVTGRP